MVTSSTDGARIRQNYFAYESPSIALSAYDIAYIDSISHLFKVPRDSELMGDIDGQAQEQDP